MGPRTSTRRIIGSSLVALLAALGALTLIDGYSSSGAVRDLQLGAVVVLGAALLTSVIVLSLVHLADWQSPASEDEFEVLVRRTERLAAAGGDERDGSPGQVGLSEHDPFAGLFGHDPLAAGEDFGDTDEYDALEPDGDSDFRALVRSAIDELPLEFHRALEHVAIVVSDAGEAVRTGPGRHGAYGLYQGDTVVQNYFHDRIVIFRDTLTRDFGHDPELLRRQVGRTVRHELAHHLGWDERGVGDLGL